MPHRLAPAAWLAPALAWLLLGLAALTEASAACTSDADVPLGLLCAGAAAALAGVLLSAGRVRGRRDAGALGGAVGVVALALAAVGLAVLPLLFAVLLLGVWRIATADGPVAARTRALLAYLVSSLWFPVAGIFVLWLALRCFTF
jgi:hypothetical protein